MNERVQEILSQATDSQRRYVRARLTYPDPAKAARSLGWNRTTPHKWKNFEDLEEAVTLMDAEIIDAAKERLARLIPVALDALERAAKGKGAPSVTAAKAILDRTGLPAQSNLDVTSGGEAIKALVYIPDNGRADRD